MIRKYFTIILFFLWMHKEPRLGISYNSMTAPSLSYPFASANLTNAGYIFIILKITDNFPL